MCACSVLGREDLHSLRLHRPQISRRQHGCTQPGAEADHVASIKMPLDWWKLHETPMAKTGLLLERVPAAYMGASGRPLPDHCSESIYAARLQPDLTRYIRNLADSSHLPSDEAYRQRLSCCN